MVGWLEVTFGQRSQFMELLVHPRYEDAARSVGPLCAAAGESQGACLCRWSASTSPISRFGFAARGVFSMMAAQHELFVKLLAVRVREPRLVTANVVGG